MYTFKQIELMLFQLLDILRTCFVSQIATKFEHFMVILVSALREDSKTFLQNQKLIIHRDITENVIILSKLNIVN